MASFPKVKTLTKPIEHPVSIEEAKAQAVIEYSDDDALIDRFIESATDHVQRVTGLSLVRQKKRLYLDGFYSTTYLPNGPVQVIDQVQYIDGDGATQTLSSSIYTFDAAEPFLRLAYGQVWPSHRSETNAVWIDYWTGYYTQGSPESSIDLTVDIPASLKQAILMLVAEYDRGRESQGDVQVYSNPAFDCAIAPHRVYVQ